NTTLFRSDGPAHAPISTRASNPLRLAAKAKCDDDKESLRRSVKGDLDTTANLADVVSGVPTKGLRQKRSGASEASGSSPAGDACARRYVPRPTPPMKRRRTTSDSGTNSASPVVRLILR